MQNADPLDELAQCLRHSHSLYFAAGAVVAGLISGVYSCAIFPDKSPQFSNQFVADSLHSKADVLRMMPVGSFSHLARLASTSIGGALPICGIVGFVARLPNVSNVTTPAFTESTVSPATPRVDTALKVFLSNDAAMQTVSTSCAWLPLSRNSMLPAFISALFNFKDLFFSPLFAPTKMSSFLYHPWGICDSQSHSQLHQAPSASAAHAVPGMCFVSPSLACRSQLLPLMSRKIGSLFQFAHHDIGQLLCSFYSGCIPVEIMTETRALLFGEKVMVIGELSRNLKGDYCINPPTSPLLAALSGTYTQSRSQVVDEYWRPAMFSRIVSVTCALAAIGAVVGWIWANRRIQANVFQELHELDAEEDDGGDELDPSLDEPMTPAAAGGGSSSLPCIVCFERKRRVVCNPCRHFALCVECARRTWDTSGRCPCCRADLNGFSSVFLA